MKNKKWTSLVFGILLLGILFAGTSCSDNNDNFNETQWKIVNITIKKNQWVWNSQNGRYEAVVNLPEMTEFIYENGASISYVFIGTQGVDETQKMLPYVETYYDGDDANGNPVIYTETISCDYQYGNPSTVAFYIKASDLARADQNLADYNFRVVLIY